jgi:ABC-type Na+ efflux pump permease subunit
MIVGSIGVGLLVLIIVWILALIIFVVGIKFQNNVAWVSLSSATVLTILLIVIPLDTHSKVVEDSDNLEKDYSFIHRLILLSFLILSALIGFIFFFILHCIEPIRPRRIKEFYTL